MHKLIWMSDPHYAHGKDVLGHDPSARLTAAIDHINTYHTDADCCVITGDMVNHGEQTDYEGLRDHLRQLSIPYLPMMGNHDNRALLRQSLALPDTCMKDFIQYNSAKSHADLICLDTHKIDSSAGEFCEQRYQWLKDTLASNTGKPAYLFMHHPPMPLGLPMQDADKLDNGERFLETIASYECVKYLFIGHVHRPITGTIKGIPFSTMRSVLLQAPAPRPEWTWETFIPAEEAPNLGVVTLSATGVTIQYEQFCRYETGKNSI